MTSITSISVAMDNTPEAGSILEKGRYQNSSGENSAGFSELPGILKDYLFERSSETSPKQAIPVLPLVLEDLESMEGTLVVKLGHSSILLRIQDKFWLLDPVFSKRASPFSWIGPKRFHEPPVSLEQLPEIEGVIISHDHYDHLDKDTIRLLSSKVKTFYVPSGVGELLEDWGVSGKIIKELDWWESAKAGDITLVATPSQHFSGRGVLDRNKRLWASWVIMTPDEKLFFSGDSGYFDGFKKIGNRYGPFDLTLMETGAYNERWSDIHMFPEESVQAHIDLRGKYLVPVHNGTFDLALHAWFDPMERVTVAAKKHQQKLLTPIVGEVIELKNIKETERWWRSL